MIELARYLISKQSLFRFLLISIILFTGGMIYVYIKANLPFNDYLLAVLDDYKGVISIFVLAMKLAALIVFLSATLSFYFKRITYKCL